MQFSLVKTMHLSIRITVQRKNYRFNDKMFNFTLDLVIKFLQVPKSCKNETIV